MRQTKQIFETLRFVASVIILLSLSISNAWGDTYTETYTNPTGNNPAARAAGMGAFSTIGSLTGNVSFGNSSLQINTNSGSGTFTVSSTDGSYISSITFTQNASYANVNSLTSSQGTVTGPSSNVFTFTPNSATLTSATFSLSAKKNKKVRIAPIVVNLTSNYEYFSKNFSISSGTVSCTKSNGSSDVTITSTGGTSNNGLTLANTKALTITSSGHNIKAIHFTCEAHNTMSNLSANTGTYGSNNWTKGTNTKSVTFTSSGSNATIVGISIELETIACTAPDHIGITGNWDYFGGEKISLTATAYDDSDDEIDAGDITGYQWQKLISSTWTDLTDGTTDGVTISGATTANLQIDNCGGGNSGKYRCKVSTGTTCYTYSATATDGSEGFGVKVYTLECYTGGTTVYNFTRVGSTQAGTLTLNLAANTDYQFKFHADNDYYGNNGTISRDVTNWVCSTSQGNLTIKSGMGGTVTIGMEYSTGGNSSVEGEPEISVTYPDRTVYMELCSDWNQNNAKFAIYYWNNADGSYTEWTDFMTPVACNNSVVAVDVPAWADRYIFVRLSSSATSGNWSDKLHQTGNVVADPTKDYYYSMSGSGDSYYGTWGTYTDPTFTITFNGNGNSGGSMSNMTGISCGGSATLTANAFTKTSNIFDVWNTAADGSGVPYADGALITDITSNITLYAQWDAEDCEVMFEGAACGPVGSPSFSASIGSVVVYNNTPANSTPNYTYLSSDGYLWLTPKSGTYFTPGDKIKAIVYNQSSGTTYTTGFRIGSNAYTTSIPPRSYRTIEHTLVAADIVDGKVKILRGIADNGYGCFAQIRAFDCETTTPTPPGVVDIPGTVDKDNVADYSSDMTWYGASDEYFDFGPTDAANLGRWAEWQVNLLSAGEYIVSVVVDFPASPNGYQWKLQLLDGGGSEVATAYESVQNWGDNEYTYDAKWDLSGVTPDIYTLRVTNLFGWAQPKLKSVTLALAGLSLTYTKTPDEAEYGKTGDSYQAVGTIDDDVVTTSGISNGASVVVSGNVLTIGSVTITAPLTQSGRLDNIPIDDDPGYTAANCTWRFDHWENVPATVTADVSDVIAVYFPTFPVEYELFGGTIHDDPYYTWYRYTGRAEDSTPLPEDVTKEGYMFGGWYQNATTQLFTVLPGHYYGGYTGAWCLKAHWLLPCDEPQTITKVTLTGSSTYETAGYNNKEYVGTPVISVSGTTASYDFGDGSVTGYELGAAGDLVFVTVKDGFRTGDIIHVAITATNTAGRISSSPNYLDLFYGTGAGDATKFTHLTEISTPGIYSYTLSADDIDAIEAANATSVGVYRTNDVAGQNPCIYSVEVFGCRDLIFDDHHGTHVWNDPLNWAPNYVEIPSYHQATRILKPCVVNIADAQAMNVKLCKGIGNNGSLVINADAALSVRDEISEVHNKDFSTLYPVAASDLVILANASNQGAVAHGDTEGNTHATVQFYGRGSGTGPRGETLADAIWQYMGVPFSDVTRAIVHYMDSWMCQWIENTAGNAGYNWKWINSNDALTPFVGYCLTQNAAKTFTNAGTLVPSTNKNLSLTYTSSEYYKGWNMFANSYMAPINITQFEVADFGAAQATIYLFNTGINAGSQSSFDDKTSAGQYIAVPIATAGEMAAQYRYISPMQGFYLLLTEDAGVSSTTVTLDYEKLVRNPEKGALYVGPNRVPKRVEEDEESHMPRLAIDVTGSRFTDRLYIFENAERTNGFDNAWDGYKFEGEGYAPQLMTRTGDLDLAVDVSPAFGGKRIAFRVGEDNEYTLHFSTTEQGLQLRDLTTNAIVDIVDGGEYSFMAFNTTSEERFEIIDNRQQLPDGFDEIQADATYEVLEMTVYTVDGRVVEHRTSDFNKPLDLPQTGVYLIRLKTTAGEQTHKVTLTE